VNRLLKNVAKQQLHRLFDAAQHVGLNLLPRHFYSPIPDLRELRRTQGWKRPRQMRSVPGHAVPHQLAFAERICRPDIIQDAVRNQVYETSCQANGQPGYGPTEALLLYAFIRVEQPRRVLQIGAGVSTAVILSAAQTAGYTPSVCCIDPWPNAFLRDQARAQRIELVAQPAQEVVATRARDLRAGDLLFVDSTHAVRPGSEVNVIILDVLPELSPGTWVHFHDVTFPYDYTRRVISDDLFFPVESTLLHAFLSCNSRYELCTAMSMLHYAAPERLKALLPTYEPAPNDEGLLKGEGHFPSAAYLKAL
jgi:hypothetical protein